MSTTRAERPHRTARSLNARHSRTGSADAQQDHTVGSLSGCLVRVCWMVLGNGALFFMAAHIAMTGSALSAVDLAFWGTVALLVALRYLDIRGLGGLTATHEPATMSHWRRYAILLLVVSFLAWAIAHGIAHLAK